LDIIGRYQGQLTLHCMYMTNCYIDLVSDDTVSTVWWTTAEPIL